MSPRQQPQAVLEAAHYAWGSQWPPGLSLTDIEPDPEPEIGR
jgi:hypothetical protein